MDRVRSTAKHIAIIGSVVLLEIVSYLSLDRYARGLNSIPTVVMEEFPEINQDLLEKFSSFDPELGWAPQPNTTKRPW